MNRPKYRKSWLRAHKAYERRFYNLLKKYFSGSANRLPIEFIINNIDDADIGNYILLPELTNVYFEAYRQIGLIHGTRIGKGINRDIKDFTEVVFQTEYQRGLYQWVIENIGSRITSVRSEFIDYLKKLIVNAITEGKDVRTIAREFQALVGRRSFYRWQALRIARTETTTIANRAAIIAGETSGIVLDKVWISALDARTRTIPPNRFDHRTMNGNKVPKDDYFSVQGELLEYPGAPITKEGNQSSAGNVIQCRCTVSLVPRRDSNGRIIRL